jgi:hypothetical protein
MFYPKEQIKLCSSQDELVAALGVHESLYKYTIKKMKSLESQRAYSLIMDHFLANYKDTLLTDSMSIQNNKQDFIEAFKIIALKLEDCIYIK